MREAGFELVRCEDTTDNVVEVARRWRDARARHRGDLMEDEGEETFEGCSGSSRPSTPWQDSDGSRATRSSPARYQIATEVIS